MSRKKRIEDPFTEITWEDMHDWVGEKILSRGRNYQKQEAVRDLVKTPDGGLIAWVMGSEKYTAYVLFEDGKFQSQCTCPYWDQCKHAVAVVLDYLEKFMNEEDVSLIKRDDPRYQLACSKNEEDWIDEDPESEEIKRIPATDRDHIQAAGWLEQFLKQKTKEELTDIISNLAGRFPEAFHDLSYQSNLAIGAVDETVKSLRREIESLTAEPAWSNHWNDECYIPDFSNVAEQLTAMLRKGYANEVLDLGGFLIEKGINLIEMSDDEGETCEEISICLVPVFKALPSSSLDRVEQMVWVVDAQLADDYSICEEGVGIFWGNEFNAEEWNRLADTLMLHLKNFQPSDKSSSRNRDYQRDRLTNQIIQALENAGRVDEVISLCKEEAVRTDSYNRLVEYLKQYKRWNEAEKWIIKGVEATHENYPGIAHRLRNELREIRRKSGDRTGAFALLTEDFFMDPSLALYQEIKNVCKKEKTWDEIRSGLLNYLEKGKLPSDWSIPASGLKISKRYTRSRFPDVHLLMDIAISEKQLGDLLRWWEFYTVKTNDSWMSMNTGDKVAEVLVEKYPDRALNIWQQMAENRIKKTNPKGYREAAAFLKKISRLLKSQNRHQQWHSYLSDLRQTHFRKRKLLEILDSLDGKPIIG